MMSYHGKILFIFLINLFQSSQSRLLDSNFAARELSALNSISSIISSAPEILIHVYMCTIILSASWLKGFFYTWNLKEHFFLHLIGLDNHRQSCHNTKVQWLQGREHMFRPPLVPPPLLMVCAPLGRPTRHSPTSLDRKLDGNNDDDDEEEEDDEDDENANCNVGRSWFQLWWS